MITRQLYLMDSLTSESTPAGGNAVKANATHNERQVLEMRARRARASAVGGLMGSAVAWLASQFDRVVAATKADFKLRTAEAQLYRMSDRELSDLGLCRADIPFAVREVKVEGVMPQVGDRYAVAAAAANRDAGPAIFWAGRA